MLARAMASPSKDSMRNMTALFARASRNSERVILPINDSALAGTVSLPAFYCVHSVSGVAGADFIDLAARLDPAVRFYGIQAPSKCLEDDAFGGSVESIAAHYTEALMDFQPSGPLVIGGYCLGAVVALEMAKNLRARGREVGPLIAIDGVPENTGIQINRWRPRYWIDLASNLRGWVIHSDLIRSASLKSLFGSVSKNALAIGKRAMGLKYGEKFLGGYSVDGFIDLSIYPPIQRSFINRLFAALFAYFPEKYSGDIVVYEALVAPLLYLPQIGSIWREFAPQAQVARIVGTHIGMMHEPYVDALAADLRRRIAGYFSGRKGNAHRLPGTG
jgi:thioesterase domain-containing protein